MLCTPHQIFRWSNQEDRWVRHVARMGERRGAYRILLGKPEGRRRLERPMLRWEDNIKIDVREVEWGKAWTGSLWLSIGTGGCCESGNEPSEFPDQLRTCWLVRNAVLRGISILPSPPPRPFEICVHKCGLGRVLTNCGRPVGWSWPALV